MIFACRHCGAVRSLPDSYYGRNVRCPGCKNEVVLTGEFHPSQYRFIYSCSCGVTKNAKFSHFGRKVACPKCGTVNAVSAIRHAPPTLNDTQQEIASVVRDAKGKLASTMKTAKQMLAESDLSKLQKVIPEKALNSVKEGAQSLTSDLAESNRKAKYIKIGMYSSATAFIILLLFMILTPFSGESESNKLTGITRTGEPSTDGLTLENLVDEKIDEYEELSAKDLLKSI